MALSNAQWFASPGAYEIDQSCRFNDDDSAYLHWTPSGAGDSRDAWSIAIWFKRCNLGSTQLLYDCQLTDSPYGNDTITLQSDDKMDVQIQAAGGSIVGRLITTQVFRDPSAWQQLVVVWDSANSTAGDRLRLWINGSEVTAFDTDTQPSSGQDSITGCNPSKFGIAANAAGSERFMDGYLTQVVFIDGTSLTPSSFGETNSDTGQWIPKDVSGLTFGTNGFLLAFQDSSALGDDTSGNGNDFTSSGLAAADQMTDSPTDNYSTWSPIDKSSALTLSNGNLDVAQGTASWDQVNSTIAVSSGKWYWEVDMDAFTYSSVGISNTVDDLDTNLGSDSNGWGYAEAGNKFHGGSSSYGASYTDGDIIGIALDLDNGAIWFSKNDSWQNSATEAEIEAGTTTNAAFTGITETVRPAMSLHSTASGVVGRFDHANCTGSVPSGFKALSTANLDDPTIDDPSAYFQPTIYTGNGSTQSIDQGGNSQFSPDFVWIKNRDAADNHCWFDTVRGATELISSNNTDAESTDADTLTAFDSDGFSLGDDDKVNTNTEKYVGWQWLEDTTSAFDMVTYTGTGSTRTVAHNLGVKPDLMIFKRRNGTQNWQVYHSALTAYYKLFLDLTLAKVDDTDSFNDTEPTASVFTVKSDGTVNAADDTYIAYLFAGVEGFSKFGSYVGNGSTDGPFVSLGFKPSALIVKRASPEYPAAGGGWPMWDNARSTYNVNNHVIEADATNAGDGAEWTAAWTYIDFLSNGFKIRGNDTETNADGSTYVFAAWADTPFKTANAR